ncbi:putative aldouronate transport system substrate-binding protein [Paenibacillus sp. yr247]|uniref:extracellular solute-binding protein n=1 Tax=Paenibacillus sp. yr247 TaxID=1761880 RepID=UPI00088B52B2|nr:extracellular solute-binding protein [Paenibacillus sp. yr247]SDO19542.1 putative aldouronate transport system substrate-binding protein [Paenibacillus sp. yr247]
MKSFKIVGSVLAAGLLVGSVIGCSSTADQKSSATGSKPEAKQKISFMYPLYNNPPKKTEAWKYMEDKLNIEFDAQAIPSAQYSDKLQASIAANDLPDITHYTSFPDPKLVTYAKQGAFLQLDDLIKDTKNIKNLPKEMWDLIKVDGKTYGIPRPAPQGRAVVIRKDWLDNLGLPIPKTLDDFYNVAVKFANADPDKNGKNDTVGIILNQTMDWHLDPIFMAFDTGNGWRKMEDGTLMSTSIAPQRKEALAWLHKLYDVGGIDKNFTIMKDNQMWEKLESGKAGLFLGAQTNDFPRFVANLKKVDPKAELIMIQPPVGQNGKTGYPIGSGFFGEFVLPAKIDKAKAKKAIELLDWQIGQEGVNLRKEGVEGVDFKKNADGTIAMIGNKYTEDGVANLIWNVPNDPTNIIALDAPAEIQKAQKANLENIDKLNVTNPSIGFVPSDAVREKKTELDKTAREVSVKIVTGELPIEAFDKFVQDWKSKGGDAYTKELNEWYKVKQSGK